MSCPCAVKEILLILSALFILFLSNCSYAQTRGEETMPHAPVVSGKLTRAFAIGGETTGWELILDSEMELGGQKIRSIEIDPAGQAIETFVDKRVEITGVLTKRQGVERGEYEVFKVRAIREVK